jgi:nucleotide-binding universal stress UspA family protein
MWNRLVLALDQFDSGKVALNFTIGLASESQARVRVIHIRQLSRSVRVPPLETLVDAPSLVEQAVLNLRMAGLSAEGEVCSTRDLHVANRIVEAPTDWNCEAIVLGSRRYRGIGRLCGGGVRGRILRLSSLPLVVAPVPLGYGMPRPIWSARSSV